MEGCARLTGNVQRGQRGVASEIHEIAPQDYAAHKRVNGKGEDGERERERAIKWTINFASERLILTIGAEPYTIPVHSLFHIILR